MQRFTISASALVLAAVVVVVAIGGAATAQDDDPAVATATRQAELEELDTLRTRVAALETQVAELRGTPGAGEAVTAGTPVNCGDPVTSWGAATASDVRVDLLAFDEPATVTEAAPSGSHYAAFELEIENQGSAPIVYRPVDFVVTDCLGNEYEATLPGVEPAVGEGELAPGASIRGWVTVLVPDGVQLALFQYNIQESDRTGANVQFILVHPAESDATP
jgi:hypothetical protein